MGEKVKWRKHAIRFKTNMSYLLFCVDVTSITFFMSVSVTEVEFCKVGIIEQKYKFSYCVYL